MTRRAIDRDPRVTRWGFYYLNLLYDQEGFDGISRDLFIKALSAEGVPIGVGAHGRPIYDNPVFETMDLPKPDCPVAEHVHQNVAMSISHRCFLGPRNDMELVLEAIRKVRGNTDELRTLAP